MKFFFEALLVSTLVTSTCNADSIYGECHRKDGSPVDGTVTISTSWNNKKAFPKKGKYTLDFGGKVDSKVTVYIDGKRVREITVKGDTKVDLVAP